MADLRIEDAILADADHRAGADWADSTRPAPPAAYLEAHSALNGPLLACGLLAPAAAETACLVLGALVNPDWFVLAGLLPLFVPVLIWTTLVYRNWPTGVRFKSGYFSRLIQPRLSSTWVVPTRHPGALSQALQAVPGYQGPVPPR